MRRTAVTAVTVLLAAFGAAATTSTPAFADDPVPAATPSAPTELDEADPDLELPEGAKLAAPKVLDIVFVTDGSSVAADEPEERQEVSNSTVTYALQSEVLFGMDSAKLASEAASRINAIAADINAQKVSGPIRVFGFTDDLGSYEHGKTLSKQRADAVYQVLAKSVTTGSTFQVRGYSEDYPIADNSSEEGRKQNRRVEITFTPPAS